MENRSLWKSIVLLLCLLPVVAFFGYWLGHRDGLAELPSPSEIVSRRNLMAQPVASLSLNDARRKGIFGRLEELPGKAKKLPDNSLRLLCESSWKAIARTRTADLQDSVRRRRLLLNLQCLQKMREDAAVPSAQYFADACQYKLRGLSDQAVQSQCLPKVPGFKAYITWVLRKGGALPGRGEDDDLAYELEGSFANLQNASAADLDRAIALANGLIESVPTLYPAYKAKLVAMILKEVKYGQGVDGRAYDDLYQKLMSFDSEAAGGGGAKVGARAAELSGIDQDLVQLPFLRLEARGEYDQVRTMAQEYVRSYPKSYVGYYYLAESAWQKGDESAAVATFRKGLGPNFSEGAAREMFLRLRAKTPLERIGDIKLQ